MDSKLARYKGITFFRSSLSELSLVNIQLPRKFYYYLLMNPSIRHLELSRVTMDDSDTRPTPSLILCSMFSLDWFRKKNGEAPVAIPDYLHRLTLESLRVHDLDTDILGEVLEATRKDKLLKLSMESPCQEPRILQSMVLLQNITSLTLSWETREARFPVMLLPRLQYLDALHFHVAAFLRSNHRVKTLKLREFKSTTFQFIPMSGPPYWGPDLATMLAPALEFTHGLESTFEGITSLHISTYGLTCNVRASHPYVLMLTASQWLTRLFSIVAYYPHVKDFSIKACMMETSGSTHAFQFSINLLHQYQGDTGALERVCFAFEFLDNLEIECRRKREPGGDEWDVRLTSTRALEQWVLVGNKLTSQGTGDVYYPYAVGY